MFKKIKTAAEIAAEKAAQESAANKQKAIALLAETDFVEVPSVSDPAKSPFLKNLSEFVSYRDALRVIAVHPTPDAVFPDKPEEIWS